MEFIKFVATLAFIGVIVYLLIEVCVAYNQKEKEESRPQKNTGSIGLEVKFLSDQDTNQSSSPKKYNSLEEWQNDTKEIWRSNNEPIETEFTYEKWDKSQEEFVKERRTVRVNQILKDGRMNYYLRGHCLARGEVRTFDMQRMTTKILYKSRRYDPVEFLEKLNVL